jgi:bacteriocin biosynthesis cyclodehydratase domain-containing protein
MDAIGLDLRRPLVLSAQVVDLDEKVYIERTGDVQMLHGKDAQTVVDIVLPLINGSRSGEEIIAMATQKTATVTAEGVQKMLRWLVDAGVCAEDCAEAEDGLLRHHYLTQLRYFGQHISFPTQCQKRLQASRVAVIGLEYVGSRLVQELAMAGVGSLRSVGNPQLLAAEAPFVPRPRRMHRPAARHTLLARYTRWLGLATRYEGVAVQPGATLHWEALLAGCNLAVCILPRWIPSLLRGFNAAGLSQGIPFLPVWLENAAAHIGPLVLPHETACLRCLELWRSSRWQNEDFRTIEAQHAETVGPAWEEGCFLVPWVTAIAALTAGQIVEALAQERRPASYGHELFFDARAGQLQCTPVLKLSRCPACSRQRHIPPPQPFALSVREEGTDGACPEFPRQS